jgi:thiol-disulfide isomerase/thioredoxin
MPVKSLKKASQKKEAAKVLQKDEPMVVLFYRETCPACQMARPSWNGFVQNAPQGYMIVEIEEAAIPEELLENITGFPTYAAHDENGDRHVTGAQTDPEQIKKALKLKTKKSKHGED